MLGGARPSATLRRVPNRPPLVTLIPGLSMAALLAAVAVWLADLAWVRNHLHVSALLLVILLGVGGAICGASAVVAADSVVQGEKRDAPLALGIITLLGTIGIVLYPLLGRALHMSDFVYGVWDGASLHEMAQVVAAGFGVSEAAARVATVVKLARIALLAPVVLWLGWSLRHRHRAAGTAKVTPVPWFLALFVVFALLNSSGWLPARALDLLRRADLWLLCVGMAGVGLETSFADLREAGLKPIATGTMQWAFLAAMALGMARWLCR